MSAAANDSKGQGDRPVVLITGCSSGIGLEAARQFGRKGWHVVASMRRPEAGAALRAEAADHGWQLETPALDVRRDDQVASVTTDLLARTAGRIDALVNNAGYYCYGPLEETSPDELRDQLDTNILGVLRLSRAVLPSMRARGAGVIINMGSISGRVVIPMAGPYHVSKWGLEALSEGLRYEVAPFGIQVVLLEPGPFDTDLHTKEKLVAEARRPNSPYAPVLAAYKKKAGRIGRGPVDQVVELIVRSASDARGRLRRPIGPTSLVGTLGRRLTPDAVYEFLIGASFRWRRGSRKPKRPV